MKILQNSSPVSVLKNQFHLTGWHFRAIKLTEGVHNAK